MHDLCPPTSGMGQYTSVIRERVATGSGMLALTETDIEKKLGITNILHRRKLHLAIEEQRRPDK